MNMTLLWQKFKQNYEWLNGVVKLPDGNRFSEVKDRLKNVAKNYDPDTNQVLKDFDQKEIFLTALEAIRFNEAVDYLRTINIPISKIRSMCKGPSYHLDEIPTMGNSEGRDIQFEFILGGLLKKAGFKIKDFDDIQIEYASSISPTYGTLPILIRYECKRPALGKNLKAKFDEAVAQLEKKIGKHDNEYGFVALCIEKIDDFDKKYFEGDDIGGVIDELIRIKNNVLKDLRDNLKVPSSRKIIGLHLFVRTPLWNKAKGTFTDISQHFTERTIQEKKLDLYDYLYHMVKDKIETVYPIHPAVRE